MLYSDWDFVTADTTLWTADGLGPLAPDNRRPLETHSAGDYAHGLAELLPSGPAWQRDDESTLMKLVAGLAAIWGDVVDTEAAVFLDREADPRSTILLLPEWERAFGLPDLCVAEPLTLADRRTALVERITSQGGQSVAYFEAVAAKLGYDIKIREYSPFMCGISRCGDTRETGTPGEQYAWEIGSPDMRFYWVVELHGRRLTWFRCGESECGVDHMLLIAQATDLECLFRRYKPGHTEVIFDYSPVS